MVLQKRILYGKGDNKTNPGQFIGMDKDNAVEVESVDALDSWDHVVHPREGLLVRAGRPLFCHYHHSLVPQDTD